MPIFYFMKNGLQFVVKGESFKQKKSFWKFLRDIIFFWKKYNIQAEGMNEHPVEINPDHMITREICPMAEFEERQKEAREKQEEEMRQNPNPGREGRIFRPGTGIIKKVN